MKIGIVTLYDAPNYGAYLQAYALQKVLRSMGQDVEFLRIDNASPLGRIYTNLPILICDLKRKWAITKALSRFNIAPDTKGEYDTVILGSDELWNFDNPSFKHYPIFFGFGVNTKNLITYAPSFGNMKSDSAAKCPYAQTGLLKIKSYSARDEKTAQMIQTITGQKVPVVLDPTILLGNFTAEEKPVKQKNYVLVYSYGMTPACIRMAKSLADSKELKLISAGIYNKWCDKNLPVSPFQFLSLVKNADCVITSTFHGLIFSVLYQKQYVACGMGEKVADLSKRLGLEDRLLDDNGSMYNTMKKPIDYEKVTAIITKERKESLDYLTSSI